MELEVLVSKKGTKVVTATNLHQALQLPKHHYPVNLRKWLGDIYEFKDGIRKPAKMKDYAERKSQDGLLLDDYYFSVELAKLITLNSRSKVKQKYAKWLFSLEDRVENAELLTKEQVLAVLELSRAMGLVSCQESSERRHLETYMERNGGDAGNWWRHRAGILGYTIDKLREQARKLGKPCEGKSQRRLLMQIDRHEMIRAAVIDLFMAIGKSERYARNLGDLAKIFAKELKVEIYNDRKSPEAFMPAVNPKVVREVKGFEPSGFLSLWAASTTQ
jgi:phage anti-repressor protein